MSVKKTIFQGSKALASSGVCTCRKCGYTIPRIIGMKCSSCSKCGGPMR